MKGRGAGSRPVGVRARPVWLDELVPAVVDTGKPFHILILPSSEGTGEVKVGYMDFTRRED